MKCPKCAGKDLSKKGKRKLKKNRHPIQIYKCKACNHRFTANSLNPQYRQRKPKLNRKVIAALL